MYSESDYIPYEPVSRMGPGRVMVFAPHPDDEVFGCGGALIQHVQDQDPIRVVVVSNGALGGNLEDLAEIRSRESEAAARLLGYPPPVFLGHPDRGLVNNEVLVDRFRSLIEAFAADIVYAPSFWEIHPDHRVVSRAVFRALKSVGRPIDLIMYEVGVPLRRPNRLLDITPHQGLKWRAMGCFESQLKVQDYRRHIEALNSFRSYTLGREFRMAEAFRCFKGQVCVTNGRVHGETRSMLYQ